ncbi:adenosylcobinamide-GDP ribazoletransferase [Bacillus massiliglaciei]|uniref:adenosylcobinamide-GDP ribazoletransferase n=1 Tax=Bacillus massiliglaciei TaxID=1816693 RepID=UPI000B2D3ED8|nr:adenosylcobinamide-GDP ribazoletransferase [Bacillus massiliglaciei]
MRSFLIGLLIDLQFFTIVPVRRELPMDKIYIHRAIQCFPLIGLLFGLVMAGSLYILEEWTPLSALAIAFLLWLLTIIWTGGLHLDGWIDVSDAFFSYQDKERRLDIMKDSRTGAFGVISVIVLLGARFLFIYEIAEHLHQWSFFLIMFLPVLSRSAMGYLLCRLPLAKQGGFGAFFQNGAGKGSLSPYGFFILAGILAGVIADKELGSMLILLSVFCFVILFFLQRKIIRWFGGITGDVIGASVEGVELGLWMVVWLLHYFVTA